jgi:broad specificity phosphatase PhoE
MILCRHGQSAGNAERRFGGHGPTPLTDLGRAQAMAAGEVLAREGVDRIYCSDLTRAIETAQLIGARTGAAPEPTALLRERSVGALTGLTFEEAQSRFPDEYAALLRRDWEACPPGGESHRVCADRVGTFLRELCVRDAGRRVVVVSHNVTIYHFVRHILGLADNPQAPLVFFQIDNCALSRFELHPRGVWKVVALNERGHLAALS